MTKKEIKEVVKEFLNNKLVKGDRIVDWDIETCTLFGQHLANTIVVSSHHFVKRYEIWVDASTKEVKDCNINLLS